MFKRIILTLALIMMPSLMATAQDYSTLYEKNVEGIVLITAFNKNGQQVGSATGFFISPRIIATVSHIYRPDITTFSVSGNDHPDYKFPVKMFVVNEKQDTGMMLMDKEPWDKFVKLEHPEMLEFNTIPTKTGEQFWAIGNRTGIPFQMYNGYISKAYQPSPIHIRGSDPYSVVHYLDTEIFPGDSGGPLFNKRGKVIGLAKAYWVPQNGAVAITDNQEIGVVSEAITKLQADVMLGNSPPSNIATDNWEVAFGVDENREWKITSLGTGDNWAKSAGLRVDDKNVIVILGQSRLKLKINDMERYFVFLSLIAKGQPFEVEWERNKEIMTTQTRM